MKKVTKWVLHKEKQKDKETFVIRRWVTVNGKGTTERLPVSQYRHIRNDEAELRRLIIRLNERNKEERTKVAVELKHAFISPELLDRYKAYLVAQIPTKSKALSEYQYLKTYFLDFFIVEKNIPDPLAWHKIHKTDWASYLDSSKVPKSAWAKKDIVKSANRFMRWLHEQLPNEVPPLRFEPLSRSKFKEIEAKRKLRGEVEEGQYIPLRHWKLILKEIKPPLAPFAFEAYYYGLRIAETLGLKESDVKKGYLLVERQLLLIPDNIPLLGPVKGREIRKVPHWSINPLKTYQWIKEGQTNLMHKDTLGRLWRALMNDLGLDYDFHDLRHTWITRMLRKHNPRDVQLAAGHKNIETTMGYAHDDRELEDEPFFPDAS